MSTTTNGNMQQISNKLVIWHDQYRQKPWNLSIFCKNEHHTVVIIKLQYVTNT